MIFDSMVNGYRWSIHRITRAEQPTLSPAARTFRRVVHPTCAEATEVPSASMERFALMLGAMQNAGEQCHLFLYASVMRMLVMFCRNSGVQSPLEVVKSPCRHLRTSFLQSCSKLLSFHHIVVCELLNIVL